MEHKKIVGVFDDEEALIHAVKDLQSKAIGIEDVFTPYPVHEVLHLVGRKSRIPTAAYFYGLFGAIAVLAFLYWTSVISWPVNYGGKPFNAFPSFIIITIVLTILTVTITSLFTFSVRAKLYPGRKAEILHPGITDNKFLVLIDADDKLQAKSLTEIESALKSQGASEVFQK
jgi:hypothetical protein